MRPQQNGDDGFVSIFNIKLYLISYDLQIYDIKF